MITGFIREKTYCVEGGEVLGTKVVDICGLVTKHLSGEIMKKIREVLGHWVLLEVFACHILINIVLK